MTMDTPDKTLIIRCHAHEKGAWIQASRADGRKLEGWIRSRLNRAADYEGHSPEDYRDDVPRDVPTTGPTDPTD